MIFGIKKQVAKIKERWVGSEVLPFIKKNGAYITKEKAIELFGLIDKDEAEALRKVNNPRGETKLHYDVVNNITSNYPNVLIIPGLGENQITHSGRVDSKAKGHRKRSA